MSNRRLAEQQPESFAFTPENEAWAKKEIAKYPPGRQASAVIALLWRAQAQNNYWVSRPAIESVAKMLDMPFIPINTDIRIGDVLVTSGIDGTYPSGLAVAKVSDVERNPAYVFARITCSPAAGVGSNKFMLVLVPDPSATAPYLASAPPEEKPAEVRGGRTERPARGPARRKQEN